VPRWLRELQTIRLGWLQVGTQKIGPLMTQISKASILSQVRRKSKTGEKSLDYTSPVW
jgi:hypothetical protein